MRKGLKFIIAGHLLLAAFLAYCSIDLIGLALTDESKNGLTEEVLKDDSRTQLIPKIIHQTYKNESIPEIWKAGQKACQDLHPDYQYILWTDEKARAFIAKEYPWFLDTWDSYPYPIERADAIRYFALAHYGGVYIDLDDTCQRKLDPLLTVPAFVRQTIPTGISNDVMGSVPNHPFFERVIRRLHAYKHNWILPYITIMISTGPLFLSIMLEQYQRHFNLEEDVVSVLLPKDYKGSPDSFFQIVPGSSWHKEDAKFIKLLGKHIGLAVLAGFLTAGVIFVFEWFLYQWVCKTNWSSKWERLSARFNKNGYRRVRPRKDSNLPAQIILKEEEMV